MSLLLLLRRRGVAAPPAPVLTGAARFPGTDVYPDPNLYPSQGLAPIVRARISTDDVSVANPIWTEVANAKTRAFSTSRGRGSEMEEFSAGSGSVTFDNRDRAFDPNVNALIRPLNRVWLYEEFAGEVHDLIKGYVDAWDLDYPGGLADATATASINDEMSVLASMALNTTDPPRDAYAALVLVDNPFGYWDFNEDSAGIAFQELDSLPFDSPVGESFGLAPERRVDRRAFPSKGHRKRG